MGQFGEILESARTQKRISLKKASHDLKIKIEYLEAMENQSWHILPDPTFTRGLIASYVNYLGLDLHKMLAFYRREFDERKYPKKTLGNQYPKRFYLTPTRLINLIFALAILAFVAYMAIQYSSILSAPRIEINSPQDDETVTIPVILITGKTEKDTTVSINGQFIAINEDGKFTYQLNLVEGKNVIDIIASKRLSPKTKIERTVRLNR